MHDIHFYEETVRSPAVAQVPRTFTTEHVMRPKDVPLPRFLLVRCNGFRVADAYTSADDPATLAQEQQMLLDLTLLHFSGVW